MTAAPAQISTFDRVKDYVQNRNFQVVPVTFKSKAVPDSEKGWNERIYPIEELERHYQRPMNIGLRLGSASGGLVDVDFDHPMALKIKAEFLPATRARFGRKSNRDSHWLFRCNPLPKSFKVTDPEKGTIIELRAEGMQTVGPVSVHPSGETIDWTLPVTPEPAEVDGNALTCAVQDIGAAVLLALRWPAPGARHEWVLHLSGWMAGGKVPFEQASKVLKAACGLANDRDWRDREKCLRSSYERHREKEPISGRKEAVELLGEKVASQLSFLMGIHFKGESPKVAAVRKIGPWVPFPVDCLPETARDFVINGSSALGNDCDPALLALPVLATLGACIGIRRGLQLKRAWIEVPVIWTAVIARSGGKKTPAHRMALRYLEERQHSWLSAYRELEAEYKEACREARKAKDDPPDPPEPCRRIIVDNVTMEKLIIVCSQNPMGLLLGRDELSGWLKSFGEYKKAGGSDQANWLQLHSAGSVLCDRKTGDFQTVSCRRAAVSVAGTIQPVTFVRAMDPSMRESGLSARLLAAMPPLGERRWSEDDIDPEIEGRYGKLLDRLMSLEPEEVPQGNIEPKVVQLTPEAKARWAEWYETWGKEISTAPDELAASFAKLEAYAARFALIHHLGQHAWDGRDCSPLSLESLECGITLAVWFGNESRHGRVFLAAAFFFTGRPLLRFWRGSTSMARMEPSGRRATRSIFAPRLSMNRLSVESCMSFRCSRRESDGCLIPSLSAISFWLFPRRSRNSASLISFRISR